MVDMNSDKVTWSAPTDPGGEILEYYIRVSQNGTVVDEFGIDGTRTTVVHTNTVAQ